MKRILNKKSILILSSVLLIILFYFTFNQRISVSKYYIKNANIPKSFDNYKIVHLSDLHYKNFGNQQSKLVSVIKNQKPDLIVLTGDMIDRNKTDYSNTENLFKHLSSIAPTYCVSGNHEIAKNTISSNMSSLYAKHNITELDNRSVQISKGNDYITLFGLSYTGSDSPINLSKKLSDSLEIADTDTFSILLNHRADIFDEVSTYGYSLVLTGHAHGGIIRIPFMGGLISNDGSFFPKYDAGAFKKNGSVMLASRGLGKSNFIPRICNKPDVVSVTLSYIPNN